MIKFFALSATAAGLLCAGCATYSERVVEKPVPATTTTVSEPVAATTVYSTPTSTTYTTTPATTTTVYTR